MPRNPVFSEAAPKAIGPYSQAVWSGDELLCSGQTPIDPATGLLVMGGIGEQTERCFANLRYVLQAAGLGMEHVVKVNVYLTDMANFPGMNTVYQSVFEAPYPARTTVAVAGLPLGASIEIELTARRPS